MLFLRGLIIGFSIALPVGPIGILCIRRTLVNGRLAGLLSGLGAATADGLYGCVAGFGLTAISNLLIEQATGLRIIGGVFLCYLGIKTLLAKPTSELAIAVAGETPSRGSRSDLIGAYCSTVLLTLTNPATILSFVAVFAGLGLANTAGNYGAAIALVLGVFCGSALWWIVLSSGVNGVRDRLTPRSLHWLNRISGLVLLAFGIIALSPI